MAEPTIAAGFARALIDLAVARGASEAQLIERSRINTGALADQDARVPLDAYLALMDAASELLEEPAFPLHFGEQVSMLNLSIVALICQAAGTAAEALRQMNRYVRLIIDADDGAVDNWFELVRDEGGLWMALTSEVYVNHPALAQSAFARCVTESRNIGGVQFAKAAHFTHDAPPYRAEYERIFKMPIVFGSDRNALLIDDDFLSLSFAEPNRYVFGILSERADALLKSLESAKTVKGRVEALLVPVLHTGDACMEQVAEKLGVSRQTLYRRLKAEGVTFAGLLDNLRRQMALHYLEGKKVSVNETAYLVGFSDPSAFSRAFKRWTGESPGAWSAAGY